MNDRVGQQFDSYRLIRLLRAGGFGEVYLGEHIYRKTEVAIKVLPQVAPDDLQCFLTEARTFRLRHPNIVQVLDFGVKEDLPFVVMEYAPNGTLRQRYPKGTRLSLAETVSYIKQIASALQHAHNERVIHRDVKPENMLLGRNGEALLSDFGIATIAHNTASQDAETIAGTIAYIAPEQIQANPRPASDQYSLGVVAYEWLCGEQPFRGTLAEVAAKHMTMPPPPLHEKLATISPEVEQVVMKALAKNPRERFKSVLEFAVALEKASRLEESELVTPAMMTTDASQPQQRAMIVAPVMEGASPLVAAAPMDRAMQSTEVASSSDKVIRAFVAVSLSRSSEEQDSLPEKSPERKITRRRLVGLGLIGLAVAGGAVGWLVSSQGRRSFFQFVQAGAPTPAPITIGTALYTYRGHTDFVNGLAWSPDGRVVASASSDQTVQVWDAIGGDRLAADGGHVFIYRGHSYIVEAVAWSPDGKRIASASWDNTVQVWPTTSGGSVYTYRGHTDGVNAVAWSPDGKRIASAGYDKTVQVWDTAGGDSVAADGGHVYTYRGHTDTVTALAWSPDSKRIATASYDNTVQVWDAVGGDNVAANRGNVYTYRQHTNIVNAVAWSPDGTRIASGSDDNTVQIWDVVGGSTIYTYRRHTNTVKTLAWSPDGKRIASGSGDKTVQVWHALDGSTIYTYRGHATIVKTVAWSPDGKRIASGSLDKTVQVWGAG